tara:strand:+ start:277 stop:489 length:213 start_codon:yes stop_codon:yes gene_type:complete
MTAHATDPRPVRRVSAVTASGASSKDDFDPVVVEAPLSISVGGEILATTMRTPGRYPPSGQCPHASILDE